MKKMNEKLLAGVLAVSAVAGTMMTTAAHAEVSASVGASNMYYWRGLDLGAGDAAVWGDLKLSSEVGLYGGIWTSSGDASNGTEYDLYLGYGTTIGDFGIDISYWSYLYPQIELGAGDLAEIVLGLSYGPVAFTYYDNQEGSEQNYKYMTLAVTVDKFNIKYGAHSEDETVLAPGVIGSLIDGYSHLDITYSYNDNLSFTLGQVVDNAQVIGVDVYPEDTKVAVNYTFPIQ
jgi:uncharacterized protein (TIGR02001 family)